MGSIDAAERSELRELDRVAVEGTGITVCRRTERVTIHVPRTVVEWHLDPASGYRHVAAASFDQPLVLVCNGGDSSSLASAGLPISASRTSAI